MDIIKDIFKSIFSLKTEQLTLISLLITLIIFILGKRTENKLKIYETRKEEYKKLINFFQVIFAENSKNKNMIINDVVLKKQFYDIGVSLAVFGSKRLYNTYCFFRALTVDEKIRELKWYSQDMIIYSFAEMYKIMRVEIGLNKDFVPIAVPEMLAFFINDFTKPEFKKKYYKYHYNKCVLKTVMLLNKITNYLPLYWLIYFVFKPIGFIIATIIYVPIKVLIITPIKLASRDNKVK